MTHTVGIRLDLARRQLAALVGERIADDRGEGVISMAIAILIVATIGAAMYLLFNQTGTDLNNEVNNQINSISN